MCCLSPVRTKGPVTVLGAGVEDIIGWDSRRALSWLELQLLRGDVQHRCVHQRIITRKLLAQNSCEHLLVGRIIYHEVD